MSVSYPMFLVVVGGLLFAGLFAIATGVLAIRLGVARGIKIIGTMLMPVVALGAAVGLLRLNPVEGEYRVGIWFLLLGLVGPFAVVYDLRRTLERRRQARAEPERAARDPSSELGAHPRPHDGDSPAENLMNEIDPVLPGPATDRR